MSKGTPDKTPPGGPLANALSNSIAAADATAQATLVIWRELTSDQREAWLEWARHCWPRFDIYLPVVLEAQERIIEAERAAQ